MNETTGILVLLGTLPPLMSMNFEKNYNVEHVVHATEVIYSASQVASYLALKKVLF